VSLRSKALAELRADATAALETLKGALRRYQEAVQPDHRERAALQLTVDLWAVVGSLEARLER
jgi:hypothetical protein